MEWYPTHPTPSPSATKRRPTDDLLDQQPLSKRLELLSLYRASPKPKPKKPSPPPPSVVPPPNDEPRMEVDNVVFIDSLSDIDTENDEDSDLEEIEPSKRGLIFLPDIDKKLTCIPAAVLGTGSALPERNTNTEVVLYNTPTSLTVSEEKDPVRRAIVEWKKRMQELQAKQLAKGGGSGTPVGAEQAAQMPMQFGTLPTAMNGIGFSGNGLSPPPISAGDIDDPDAMDVEL